MYPSIIARVDGRRRYRNHYTREADRLGQRFERLSVQKQARLTSFVNINGARLTVFRGRSMMIGTVEGMMVPSCWHIVD